MIPARRTLYAAVFPLALSIIALFFPRLQSLSIIFASVLTIAMVIDMILLSFSVYPVITRVVSPIIPIGHWSTVTLEITWHGLRTIKYELFDGYPPSFTLKGLPIAGKLTRGQSNRHMYEILPVDRGDFTFSFLHLRVSGVLGLAQNRKKYILPDTIKVYPDFQAFISYTMLGKINHLNLAGIRSKPLRGEGFDFHQLREYRSGDERRQIDWKASNRFRKLISREYQQSCDQKVIFFLDSSGRLSSSDNGLGHFDQVLNAALLLAHTAIQQRDAVGMYVVARPPRWLKPCSSGNQLGRIQKMTYDLKPADDTPDVITGLEKFETMGCSRSLLILMTNITQEDSREMYQVITALSKKHVVLLCSLRETVLDHVRQRRLRSLDDALLYGAVTDFLLKRKRYHTQLKQAGIHIIDTHPVALPAALVNNYLSLKRQGSL